MILQLFKTFSDLIMPPPTASETMKKASANEKWRRLNTTEGHILMEEESTSVKLLGRPKNKKEWEEFCMLMHDRWQRNGFSFRASHWLNMKQSPPSRQKQAPPSNAKETRVPPEEWEIADKENPRYHNKENLTEQEIELFRERGESSKTNFDLEKAACIKFLLSRGYAISKEGYSNSTLAAKLTSQYGKGYSIDTVKTYAAVLRSAKNETHPSLVEW